MRNRRVTLAVAGACLVGVAAYATGSSSASSPARAAAAAPIKLMTIGPTSAPGFSLPSIPTGAKVAVSEVNAAGGINGHKLQLIVCNDKNDPNTAAGCARQAVKQKVTAVVGGLSIFDVQVNPLLARAGIPWIALTTSDQYSSKNLFLLGGEGAPDFAGIGMTLVLQGCKSVAVVVSGQASPDITSAQISAGVRAEHAKVAGTFVVPATATDLAPTVAAARSAGADCIGSGLGPAQGGPLIIAANASSGKKLKISSASGGLPPAVIRQLGHAADGVILTSGYLPFSASGRVIQQLGKKIVKAYPGTPLDQFAQTGYAGVKLVQAAEKGLKNNNSPGALTAALGRIKRFDTGLGPVVNLSKPNPIPGFERVFNPKFFMMKASNGVIKLAQARQIDATPALKLLSKK